MSGLLRFALQLQDGRPAASGFDSALNFLTRPTVTAVTLFPL